MVTLNFDMAEEDQLGRALDELTLGCLCVSFERCALNCEMYEHKAQERDLGWT